MPTKAKHAFGNLENVDSALASNKIDAYDILFLKDAEGNPYIGWIDREGNKVIIDNKQEIETIKQEIVRVEQSVETSIDEAVASKVEESVSSVLEEQFTIVEF